MALLFFPLLVFLTISVSPGNCIATRLTTPETAKSIEIVQKITPEVRALFAKKKLAYGSPVFIRIFKKSLELELWVRKGKTFKLFKTYYICDLSGSLGPKVRKGDLQAPEGFYSVAADQLNPWSHHHLSFNLGYPNDYDLAYQRTGGDLMVHGKCNSLGCFAMTDFRIEEIYTIADSALLHGQEAFQVHIFPFRMTEHNMRTHRGKWTPFWKNLKDGYDLFEKNRIPPQISVENCRYTFSYTDYRAAAAEAPVEQICAE